MSGTQKLQLSSSTRNTKAQPARSSSANYPLNQPSSVGQRIATNDAAKDNEKVKSLKAENKKLVQLLRDSEKLFYKKIQQTKKESENLNEVFKQVWPLIKHKVKDPSGLLKTIGLSDIGSGSQSSQQMTTISQEDIVEPAQSTNVEVAQLRDRLTQTEAQLSFEREQRATIEKEYKLLQQQLAESRAFNNAVQLYATQHKPKRPTNQPQPIDSKLAPAFLKALYIPGLDEPYSDDLIATSSGGPQTDLTGPEQTRGSTKDNRVPQQSSQKFGMTSSLNTLKEFSPFSKPHQNSFKGRDSSAQRASGTSQQLAPQPKPPRDRSNPVQTKILQQNNFFQLVPPAQTDRQQIAVQNIAKQKFV